MILTAQQVKQHLYNAGFRGSHLNAALQIAYCESGYNSNAHNLAGEDSRGLMQINVAANANPQYKNYNLFDPGINTRVAYQIYSNRNYTFRDWTCAHKLGLVNPIKTDYLLPLAFASLGLLIYFYYS